MREHVQDPLLDRLLGHEESLPSDEFVLDVMHQVQRQQRIRKLILLAFGLIGAAFGLIGAILLANPISELFGSIPAMGVMQTVLFVAAAVCFYIWFMNDDLSLPN